MLKLISIGDLIDQSWERYRASWPLYLGISGWALLIVLLDIIALAFYPNASTLVSGANLTGGEMFGFILYAATNYILAPLLGFWIFLSLLKAASSQDSKRTTATRAMKETRSLFIPSFGAAILLGATVILALVVTILPIAILLGLGGWLKIGMLMVLGNALIGVAVAVALVLTIRWTVEYFFAPYLPLLEGKTPMQAMRRSRALVAGRFWAVVWRLVIPKLVFVVFGVLALSVLTYIANIFVAAMAGLNIDVYARLTSIMITVFPLIIAMLLNPLLVIADMLLYRSLNENPTT